MGDKGRTRWACTVYAKVFWKIGVGVWASSVRAMCERCVSDAQSEVMCDAGE